MIEYYIASVQYPPSPNSSSYFDEDVQTFYTEEKAQDFIDERVKAYGQGDRLVRRVVLGDDSYRVTIITVII